MSQKLTWESNNQLAERGRNSLPVASGVPGGVCVTGGAGGIVVFNNRAALVS